MGSPHISALTVSSESPYLHPLPMLLASQLLLIGVARGLELRRPHQNRPVHARFGSHASAGPERPLLKYYPKIVTFMPRAACRIVYLTF